MSDTKPVRRWVVRVGPEVANHAAYRGRDRFSLHCGRLVSFSEIDAAYACDWDSVDCPACRESITTYAWPPHRPSGT